MNAIRTTKKSDPAPAETASRAAVKAGAGVYNFTETNPAAGIELFATLKQAK